GGRRCPRARRGAKGFRPPRSPARRSDTGPNRAEGPGDHQGTHGAECRRRRRRSHSRPPRPGADRPGPNEVSEAIFGWRIHRTARGGGEAPWGAPPGREPPFRLSWRAGRFAPAGALGAAVMKRIALLCLGLALLAGCRRHERADPDALAPEAGDEPATLTNSI